MGGVGCLFELPWVERCVVDVVVAYVLKLGAGIGEVVVVLVWVTACRAGVVGGKVGCFEHAASSEGVSKYGSDVVVEVIVRLAVFRGKSSNDVFEKWGFWFAVEQSRGVWVNVCVGGEVDVFPLGSADGVVNGESKFEVVAENIVRGEKGKGVAEWGVNSPEQDINFPANVLEEVNNWLEWVVGSWFWFS